MVGKKDLFAGFLVGCCVMALLFAILPTRSVNDPNYSPWTDLNDDGVIDSTDLGMMGTAWGSFGDPIIKASLQFDSGWVNISDKCGQYFNVTHNLNSFDFAMEISGKRTPDGTPFYMEGSALTHIPSWTRTYGGYGDVCAYSLVQTNDGGYAMAGYMSVSGQAIDCCLVKTDASGNMLWNKTCGGTVYDVANCVVQTSDGGYALAGYTNSSGAGGHDCYLVKTNAAGDALWNKTYGGTGDESAYSLVQTGDGGYALAGDTDSYGSGSSDCYLVKTDALGNMLWNKTYGGVNLDGSFSLVQTADGGYALAGQTESFSTSRDCYLVKTDTLGNIQWNKTYAPTGWGLDCAYSLVLTSDGGYALAGYTTSFGSFDCYLVKTDASGNMQWNSTYGGLNDDCAYSLVQTRGGGYALAGKTNSYGNAPNDDCYFVKTDASGNMVWNTTYGTPAATYPDIAYSLVQTIDGGYTLAGGTVTYSSGLTKQECYLVRVESELGLCWTSSTLNTITLYRGITDPDWNYVRVRIWTIKQTP